MAGKRKPQKRDADQLLSVLQKAHAGELPEVHRAVLAAGYSSGPRYVVTSTDEVGAFFGVSERRVHQWIKAGLPRQQTGTRPVRYAYDLRAIVGWRLAQTKESKPDSDALERLRNARARREELALARETKTLIPREDADTIFDRASLIFRRFGELLQKQYGRAAWELWDEHLSDAERSIREALGNE